MPPNNFNVNSNPMNTVPTPPPVVPTPPLTPPVIPTPTPKPPVNNGGAHPKMKLPLGLLLLIIIIALAYLGYSKYPNLFKKTNLPAEKVMIEKIDFSKVENIGKLPDGFPTNIPVEKSNLIESTKITYSEQKSVLYSVSFNSARQSEELYAQYKDFLSAKNGFVIDNQVKTVERMAFQATKTGTKDNLSVTITPQSSGTILVQISYVSKL